MNRKLASAALILMLSSACASYNAYQKARTAEVTKDWDEAIVYYEKALAIDPRNTRFKLSLQRAKREASREHFEKGKSLRAAAATTRGDDQIRLAQLAATELELTVRLDPTNQFAAVELGKAIQILQEFVRAADPTIDEMKKRAKITKAQPPALNPASDEPISLSFPRETPVKDIYRALGNAFGINILFDQAVKDDRIAIELRDVTAQQALERVMQAANHFYKVLDERTIIVVPDNPQARRDYEDLVIRTFYLSNGDAEQVTNVVRTMIEARNVFPLKALNAITIRDTADKVRIAEKIIEANDKAKAEVVVTVELVQLDINKLRDIGLSISGGGAASPFSGVDDKGVRRPFTGGTLAEIAATLGSLNDVRRNVSFTIPTATYSLMKSLGNTDLLANPELRISEGEKATLHIGQRIPVPVTTFTTAVQQGQVGSLPATSFQYQDVGIKVSMEPRVHHNREVTLKLTVEVSNQGDPVTFAGQEQPTFSTRTIESTIRLKDGETNFLAGLIQETEINSDVKTPFLGDIPVIGRLFTESSKTYRRTDLVLTMTPHIIRIPDITEDDLAPMWVGTTNNLTFRGVSPRIESQSGIDPFTTSTAAVPRTSDQFGTNPAAFTVPAGTVPVAPGTTGSPASGSGPSNPFERPAPVTSPPAPTPQPQSRLQEESTPKTASVAPPNVGAGFSPLQDGLKPVPTSTDTLEAPEVEMAALRMRETPSNGETVEAALSPRISPQPSRLALKPGEMKMWSVVGMDLDGLTTTEVLFHYDARSLNVTEVTFGPALETDVQALPIATIDPAKGTIRITSRDGSPLRFRAGGEIFILRVFGGTPGETFLVVESPTLKSGNGQSVVAAIAGGRARVE